MHLFRHALACAALCVSGAGSAQVAPVPAKTVKLSKVILNPDIPKDHQHVKVGTICLLAGRPLDFGLGERTLNYERFERLFATVMQARGFAVIAKSSNLFEGEGNNPGPDFLIGATFHPESVEICDSINGVKGKLDVSVEWQVYDRSKQKVVEAITTRGSGELPKFSNNGLAVLADNAFSASLGALIDQGTVQKYLGDPVPHAQPEAAGQSQPPKAN